MRKTLIKNGYVVTMNSARDVLRVGSVAIDGRHIAAVSPGELQGDFDEVVDAGGMIVVPGLINAHQHFYYHLFKGIANGLLIEDWFPAVVHRVAPHLTDEDMELTSHLACMEMLLSGTTCSLNHLRLTSSEAALEKMAAPSEELGMRQVIGKEVQCRLPGNPSHPRDLEEEIRYLDDLVPRWKSRASGLTTLCLAVECNAIFIEQQVTSEALLTEAKRLADRHDLKITTHISAGTLAFEKAYMRVLRKTGRTDTLALMQLGLLDHRFVLAHGINCTATDIAMIADSGASVVYTPTSEAIRGGGITPVVPMHAAGVNVALGSDGPMVDYSVDMVEQMKACSLLQHAKHLDPTVMGPERCIEMATINAAKALGLDSEIGSLEVGKRADIAIFDLSSPHAMPANNPLTNLVYSARGPDVHTVIVDGRIVVQAKKLVGRKDVGTILSKAAERAETLISSAGLEDRAKPSWQENQRRGRQMKQNSKSRRKFLKSGLAAAAATAFGLTGLRQARAQKLDTVNIAASPFINQSVVFLPKELGLYAKVGIEPQIRTFPDGALIVAPMIAGDVDLGVVTSSAGLFNSISRGAAMKAVLCTGQAREGRAGTAIVVRTDHFDAGVKSLNDLKALKGKTVAVGAAGSINQYSMSRGLAASGLNPLTDVTWQTTVAQPDIVKQLGQKQIDAAELTYFLAFLAQRQGFGKIIASRDDTAPGSQVSMLAVRDDFLAKQRDVLVRYAMAHIHAARLFNKVAGAPEQNRDTVELITKNIFVKDITLLNAIAPHWEYVAEGAPNETSVMAQQGFWADTFKMVERKVAAPRIMDSSIAGEALKRLDAEKPFG